MLASLGVTPVLAHFGHWYFQLLYAVPVTVIVGALSLQSLRDGRARKARERAERTKSAASAPGRSEVGAAAERAAVPPRDVLH
jgi:hypothetical protein